MSVCGPGMLAYRLTQSGEAIGLRFTAPLTGLRFCSPILAGTGLLAGAGRMNHISVIQWICGALAVIATLVGLGFFTRACLTIANRFRLGAPVDRQRLHPVGKRLKLCW